MSRTNLLALSTLCLFAASACESDTNKPDASEATNKIRNGTEEPKINIGICSLLSPVACAAEPGCRVQSAIRYEADKVCHHPAEPIECVDVRQSCPAVVTYAKDLAGNTWRFQDGCIPLSWQPFRAGEADQAALSGPLCSAAPPACSSLSPNACAAVAGCRTISATRYNANHVCHYAAEPVECMDAELLCTAAPTYAKDLKGNTWRFQDGCIPASWQPFQEGEADKAALAGPRCAPPCGARYNVNKGCRYSLESVEWLSECINYGNSSGIPGRNSGNEIEMCTQVITCVKDSAGNVWQFMNGCQHMRDFGGEMQSENCKSDSEITKLPVCP